MRVCEEREREREREVLECSEYGFFRTYTTMNTIIVEFYGCMII